MISVCMATYNGASFIREQATSILLQLAADDEIVVSDDGSTDDTIQILESMNDPRIRILHNTQKHGVVGNFGNAIQNAKGEYIFLSDQDDVWTPDKVKVVMHKLKDNDLVLHNMQFLKNGTNNDDKDFFSIRPPHKGFLNNIIKNTYTGCCMAFRRSLLTHILPFPSNIIIHDLWIGLVAEHYATVHVIHTPLLRYRRHGNNASFNGEGHSGLSFFTQIHYRFQMLMSLFFRFLHIC